MESLPQPLRDPDLPVDGQPGDARDGPAERAREMSALLVVARSVSLSLQLGAQLGLILDQVRVAVPCTSAALLVLDENVLSVHDYRGPVERQDALQLRIDVNEGRATRRLLDARDPVIFADMHGSTPVAREFQRQLALMGAPARLSHTRALIYAPLVVKDSQLGALCLTHALPGYFSNHQLEVAVAFASQAAMALYNARLYERAQSMAIMEERQRLARELHDSVSQALYGISLGTRTARALAQREPAKAMEAMDYVLGLSETALSEMRALIFELRPESLEREGLGMVLQKMAAALEMRHKLRVEVDLAGFDETPLRGEHKLALQRIAQECFHNATKHARAARLRLRLSSTERSVTLEIEDDGVGFDATASYPGHFGLVGMRERAEALFGTFVIESTAGKGTRAVARLPLY